MSSTLAARGSSPLTRGKLNRRGGDREDFRLIPAHAGKTGQESGLESRPWAHPRSRGENRPSRLRPWSANGSSPLTRGKRRRRSSVLRQVRLIPAHAGKTRPRWTSSAWLSAHPRSRGENANFGDYLQTIEGSSPLTRGKPGQRPLAKRSPRLIPAHAGKTRGRCARNRTLPAHPRSRGENRMTSCASPPVRGSSPLTRGKRTWLPRGSGGRRLIPAHAGKTGSHRRFGQMCRAHPRSRGEN